MVNLPIRVAGMAAHLPGAHDLEALRDRLRSGKPAFTKLSALRWDYDVYAEELPPGHARCELGATLDDIEVDWRKLRLPPLAVARMHMMEKVALDVMAKALTDAGIEARGFNGERTRVYLAATTLAPDPRTDHGRRIRRHELAEPLNSALRVVAPERAEDVIEYIDSLFNIAAPPVEPDSMASSASILAGRICNLYDLRGGHVAVDGSTTSSLTALELALEDLRAGVCDVALVVAVSPLVTPSGMLAFAHRGVLSASGPRPFFPRADGTLLGEGALALVLDRGSAAPAKRARGWVESVAGATLSRGASRVADAVTQASQTSLAEAGAAGETIAFVATRAGGVPVVETDEAAALAKAYGSASRTLPIACTVPIFGHLGPASGMLALVHGLLALEDGKLHAPSLEGASLPSGLTLGAEGTPLKSDARAAVSDVGMAPRAYHAIIAGPTAHLPNPTWIEGGTRPIEPLAITGMGLVVPRARDVATFWSNVLRRVDSIGDLPRERWDVERFIGANDELGAILKTRLAAPVDLPALDPVRHKLAPASASSVDPAVLLALECAAQALGASTDGPGPWARDRVAVIAGQLSLRWAEADVEKRVLFTDHLALAREAMHEADLSPAAIEAVLRGARERFDATNVRLSTHTLGARTGLECAAHVARVHGFGGPMLTVDAACASSLAAIDRAARKLYDRTVDAALVVGVAYNLLPEYYVVLSILGALSPRGAPPFHLGADGFVPGEGAGAVVLERLSDAQRRGAKIDAVIRGVGVSSDGAGVSIFAPNTKGEQLSISRALTLADVDAREIDLIEAHGTGTKLGDVTEIQTYRASYGDRESPLVVGTAKSQIGHLSSAAGMIGLIKSAMAVREGTLPPTLGDALAPELGLDRGPIQLPTEARPWIRPGGPRRAGVSAFGLGGVNYHVIVEQAPADPKSPAPLGVAPRPPRTPLADRFEAELVPLSLGERAERPPRAPLAGRVVWLVPDQGRLWEVMGQALETRRAKVVLIRKSEDADRAPQPDGILDLSAFGRTDEDPLSSAIDTRAIARVQLALDLVRRAYDRMARSEPNSGFYAAVTSLGGDLGLSGIGAGDLSGSALLGLAKGLKQELPNTLSRGIDFDPDEEHATVTSVVLLELEDGNDQLEVAWSGRRLVSRLRRLPLRDEVMSRPVRAGGVVLISGGGRGVVFECATALARFGAKVVVCGRTPPPDEAAPYIGLDDAAFEAWAREHMLRRKSEDRAASPKALRGEIEAFRRARELWQNLERARRASLSIEYATCDASDRHSVDALVADVRRRLGPIVGLAHGAMVQWSTLASRKEPKRIAATLSVKSEALANLLLATADDPLEIVLGFGSGAGRFGNRGQADYCAANALMAGRIAAAGRRDRRGTRYVTVDWTAWDSVGAAVEDPDLAELLRATGITSISIEEGTAWFLKEWTSGSSGEVVVFEERMLHDWPFLGRQPELGERGRVEEDDLGRPLVPGAWPMIDRVLTRTPQSLVIERRLDVTRDRLLDQHRIHGVPILPATFGCELLAEVAALAVPGFEVDTAFDVRIETPAKLFREEPLLLHAEAVVGVDGLVTCESRSRLMLRGQAIEQRVHHRGRFKLRPIGSAAPEHLVITELDGPARARSFFHMAEDPVRLGPLFSRGQWIQIHGRTIVGVATPPRPRDAMDRTSYPLFQVDPLIMDTAFQIAANYDGLGGGPVSIPYGIDVLRVGRKRKPTEEACVRAVVSRSDGDDVYYDIDVATRSGDMLMEIRGLHLRRIRSTAAP